MNQVVKYQQGRNEIWFVNGKFFCSGDIDEFQRHVKTEFKHSFMNADNTPPMTIAEADENIRVNKLESVRASLAMYEQRLEDLQKEMEELQK